MGGSTSGRATRPSATSRGPGRIVSSGRALDLPEHLRFLDAQLGLLALRPAPAPVSTAALWAHDPRPALPTVLVPGPHDPLGHPQRQTRLLVSYLCNAAPDLPEAFALRLMATLLFDGPAAPFHRALIDANLGSAYAPGTGYDPSTARAQLAVGLQGLHAADVPAVIERIAQTFADVRANLDRDFAPARVEAALHQVQLALRYNSANFGLTLVSAVTQAWAHQADPLASLAIDHRAQHFRAQWRAHGSALFGRLLDRYVIDSPSRLVFVMHPRPDYAATLDAAERRFVDEQSRAFTDAHRARGQQAHVAPHRFQRDAEAFGQRFDAEAAGLLHFLDQPDLARVKLLHHTQSNRTVSNIHQGNLGSKTKL